MFQEDKDRIIIQLRKENEGLIKENKYLKDELKECVKLKEKVKQCRSELNKLNEVVFGSQENEKN